MLVALLALGFASGCGSNGDTTSSGSSATPSKAQFIKEGNALCSKRGAQISAEGARILQQSVKDPDKAQAQIVNQVIIPNFEAEIRELRALGVPAGDSQDVERVLAAIQSTVDRLRTTPPINISASFKVNHPYRPGEEIAESYGLTSCGHP